MKALTDNTGKGYWHTAESFTAKMGVSHFFLHSTYKLLNLKKSSAFSNMSSLPTSIIESVFDI